MTPAAAHRVAKSEAVGTNGVFAVATVNEKVVDLDSDPEVPVTVNIDEPAGVPGEVDRVTVSVQFGVHDVEENEAVVPVGRFDAERVTDSGIAENAVSVMV